MLASSIRLLSSIRFSRQLDRKESEVEFLMGELGEGFVGNDDLHLCNSP